MRVAVSARVINRDVGGNTRYARNIHQASEGSYSSHLLVAPRDEVVGKARVASYLAFEGTVWPRTVSGSDVLHFPADSGPLVTARIPIVTTIHGVASRHVSAVRSRSAEKIWRARVGRAARLSTEIITDSNSSAEDVSALFSVPREKIHVIPLGVEPMFSPASDESDDRELLHRLAVPDEFYLYVGNLDPRKNVAALVRAADRAYASTGVPLVVIGSRPWGANEAEVALRESQSVIHLGRQPDEVVIAAMRRCLLFCFPSHYEGFGLPVLEAMACGAPVLCSNRGSLPEVVGDAAFVTEDISDAGLLAALLDIIPDHERRAKVAGEGLARAQSFTWERTRKRHLDVFQLAAQ